MTQDHSSVTVVNERPIQFQGNRLAAWLLKRLGWTLYFDGLPGPHGVMVVYPRTSNWDFFIGLLAKWAMGLTVITEKPTAPRTSSAGLMLKKTSPRLIS